MGLGVRIICRNPEPPRPGQRAPELQARDTGGEGGGVLHRGGGASPRAPVPSPCPPPTPGPVWWLTRVGGSARVEWQQDAPRQAKVGSVLVLPASDLMSCTSQPLPFLSCLWGHFRAVGTKMLPILSVFLQRKVGPNHRTGPSWESTPVSVRTGWGSAQTLPSGPLNPPPGPHITPLSLTAAWAYLNTHVLSTCTVTSLTLE